VCSTGRQSAWTTACAEAAAQRRERGWLCARFVRRVRVVVVRGRAVAVRRTPVRARERAGRERWEVRDLRVTADDAPLEEGRATAGASVSVITRICGWPRSCGGRAASSIAVNWTTTGLAPTKVRMAST
jgi:hypothetical protein